MQRFSNIFYKLDVSKLTKEQGPLWSSFQRRWKKQATDARKIATLSFTNLILGKLGISQLKQKQQRFELKYMLNLFSFMFTFQSTALFFFS